MGNIPNPKCIERNIYISDVGYFPPQTGNDFWNSFNVNKHLSCFDVKFLARPGIKRKEERYVTYVTCGFKLVNINIDNPRYHEHTPRVSRQADMTSVVLTHQPEATQTGINK